MSINLSTRPSSPPTCLPASTQRRARPPSSTSANTDRTTATLATHKSLFPTMLPSLIPTNNSRQTNNSDTPPPSRRKSLAKSTTASLAKMVPSLSKKVIDRGDITTIPHRQRTQSFSTNTSSQHQPTLVRRWSLKMHDTQPSLPYTTHGSNKHGYVLNSTIPSSPAPSQTRRHSRDPFAQRRSSLASITHQNKAETLHPTSPSQLKTLRSASSHSSDLGHNQPSCSPTDDSKPHAEQHHHHHRHHPLHRRTSIAAPVSDPNNSSSLIRRRSLADVSSRSAHQQQQQQPSRLRHPSWLDSAGFMQPSKCAACHPPPSKRTTVLTPPVSVGVPSFGLPASNKSRRSSVICEKSDPLFGHWSRRRSSVDTLPRKLPWDKPSVLDTPPPSQAAIPSDPSPPSSQGDPPSSQGDSPEEETNKESGISSSSLMSDDTTQFTMPSSSSSPASSVSDVLSVKPTLPPKSDFEQWTTKLRLTLGRWFSDLNHGQLEHCETDNDGTTTLTISGVVVAPYTHHPYLLRLDPDDPAFAFTDQWASDDAVHTCQFKTDAVQCACTFDLINRRHHCRKCGDIFCKDHSSNRLPLFSKDRQTQLRWSRVCDTCCFQLVGPHLAAV